MQLPAAREPLCAWAVRLCPVTFPEEAISLDAELSPFGGVARAIMDDVYAVGPPSIVFPAVRRFRATLELLTGLTSNVRKFVCYSPEHDLLSCPWRADARVPLGVDLSSGGRGVMVAGVPVGDDLFVRTKVKDIADGVVAYVRATAVKLRDHPQALWAALYYGCQSRFDYWLRHVAPRVTSDSAALVDAALLDVGEQLTYAGCLRERLTLSRVRLPGRMGGCGLRARADVAHIAFAACVAESVPRLVGPQGYFPSLAPSLGSGRTDFHVFVGGRLPTADIYRTIRKSGSVDFLYLMSIFFNRYQVSLCSRSGRSYIFAVNDFGQFVSGRLMG